MEVAVSATGQHPKGSSRSSRSDRQCPEVLIGHCRRAGIQKGLGEVQPPSGICVDRRIPRPVGIVRATSILIGTAEVIAICGS